VNGRAASVMGPHVAPRFPGHCLVVVVGLGLALGACGGGRSRPATATAGAAAAATGDFLAAEAGLCQARAEAASDPKAARATFFDRSHQGLHAIARELEGVDRAAAARLLEAKQAVEADFTGEASPAKLRDDLGVLSDTTRAGLDRLKVAVAACGN